MFNPIATYRIQFHKEFTFKNFMEIIPYLHDLGVNTIYASPIFEATPGSNHGYDVLDPHQINPEIGTLEELLEISKKLKELNMNWLQDIVPNHMAFHPGNKWLMDVLEKGQDSAYARFFDILWDVPAFEGKLMVPFLGSPLTEIITNKELSLNFTDGKFMLCYADQQYPVNPQSVIHILRSTKVSQPANLKKLLDKANLKTTSALPDDIKTQLASNAPDIKKLIRLVLDEANQDNDLLLQIANEQYYQLCFWQDSDRQINYRRFFTVNGLICLNIQDEEVFTEYHRLIKDLLDKGVFQGLRVDHIDGLYDPKTYLERLRALAGDETYIVVEKILETGEQFPSDWPVQGNTGYDFLGNVNNLLTSAGNKIVFTNFYQHLTGKKQQVQPSILNEKSNILYKHMGGELDNLCWLFNSLNLPGSKKINTEDLKAIIAELLIRCPVYRYYGNSLPLSADEAKAINNIFKDIIAAKPKLKTVAQTLNKLFTRENPSNIRPGILKFYQRCMQFTGPLMAKGVEDTLMYTYNRFIGHNEVGDSPGEFGITADQFHVLMQARQAASPLSLNGTSTHDTKRGEDVRAKLNVLTDIPADWFGMVNKWQQKHEKLKKQNMPDANDEYFIYQTIAGIYPPAGQPDQSLVERLQAYLTKALREAKRHTQWATPNEDYEKATLAFVQKLLNDKNFQKTLQNLLKNIAEAFALNSLTQVLLKFTCPGVPDIYQGCELWDLSLVDPDNRRPIDYQLRANVLKQIANANVNELWKQWPDGNYKLWLTHQLLKLRKSAPKLFTRGAYIPLQVSGKYKKNLVAFARQYQRQWLIVVAPLNLAAISENNLSELQWEDTHITLPDDAPLQWQSVFTNEKTVFDKEVSVADIWNESCLGLWRSAQPNNKRSAGVIMHISSLPSNYGIGDMGSEARKFASFLSESHQRYWQLLPVNPTTAAASYSPYSAFSAMAGNTLLISLDDMARDGLLTYEEIAQHHIPASNKVKNEEALALKSILFETAFGRFSNQAAEQLKADYELFKKKEQYWLDDFVLYDVIKTHNSGLPWYKWPENFKCRDNKAITKFSGTHTKELDKAKWLQFIFFRQWNELKTYGHNLGITFFGDLPFYVSYDSADVWAHPEMFDLDENKNIAGVAGVPPDYFSITGQLWGMPVYRWENHKTTGYSWWIDRIKKNREFFDVIRLDHFRAFYDYWRVPASETTAINGKWEPGPGSDIFRAFEKELGELPFIAEDLGEVSEGVYLLRDEFGLPGMNLLQYAFGADMPVSIHILHNHVPNSVTYTGTHDNNTTLGWFTKDSTAVERENLAAYMRTKVTANNVGELLMEVCYSSVSALAILPMQDILGLDERSRMNTPSSKQNNWLWRMDENLITAATTSRLRYLVKKYNR